MTKKKLLTFILGIFLMILGAVLFLLIANLFDNPYITGIIYLLSGISFFLGLFFSDCRMDGRRYGYFVGAVGIILLVLGFITNSGAFVLIPCGYFMSILGIYWIIFVKRNPN